MEISNEKPAQSPKLASLSFGILMEGGFLLMRVAGGGDAFKEVYREIALILQPQPLVIGTHALGIRVLLNHLHR
jgi:hypothetical protein